MAEKQNTTDSQVDILIIGGGIYGVAALYEASKQGAKALLIEKDDFGVHASASSLKIIHGGFRYLQSGDILRMRESIRERNFWLREFPDLVKPLECILPIYNRGMKRTSLIWAALKMNDLIGWDRNKGLSRDSQIKAGKIISRDEVLQRVPGILSEGLRSGAVWHDALAVDTEKLIRALLEKAKACGGEARNKTAFTRFTEKGIEAFDQEANKNIEINASVILNTAGAWRASVSGDEKPLLTLAFNVVLKKKLPLESAVALYDPASSKNQVYFAVPWNGVTMIGTEYLPYEGEPKEPELDEKKLDQFLDKVNQIYPAAKLTRDDVDYCHKGLLPAYRITQETGEVELIKHYKIIDHAEANGPKNLVSILGVKYTTARDVTERAVKICLQKIKS